MKQVGIFTQAVIDALSLSIEVGTPILIGDSNIAHMKSRHPDDFEKYGADIELILNEPDYVGQNPKDASVEYVKEYCIDGEFVKVAVRISKGGAFYARSVYVLNNSRVKNFIAKGTLKRIAR